MRIYSEAGPIILGASIQCVVLGIIEEYSCPMCLGLTGISIGTCVAAIHP